MPEDQKSSFSEAVETGAGAWWNGSGTGVHSLTR